MGLESVTFISDLVVTNPVGATDPKSQGDDHIRNLKLAIKNTFPNITGAVTLTQAQINDAARQTAANLFTTLQTITVADSAVALKIAAASGSLRVYGFSSGAARILGRNAADSGDGPLTVEATTLAFIGSTAITLNGVAFTDFARLSQSNTFTNRAQVINATGVTSSYLQVQADSSIAYFAVSDGASTFVTGDAAGNAVVSGATGVVLSANNATGHHFFTSSNTTTTFNGVAVSDFARLSQSNTFTNAAQGITAASAAWSLNDGGTVCAFTSSYIGAISNVAFSLRTNNTARLTVSAGGDFDFKGGLVTTNNASAGEVGPVGAIGRNISASSNTAASDAGRSVQFTGGSSQTFTLDGDPPTDSVVLLVNRSGNNWSIAASGTLTFGGVTGTRTMATGSMASAFHLGSGNWYISGSNLT